MEGPAPEGSPPLTAALVHAGPGRRAGYGAALGSGALWGLDGVVLGIVLAMSPFAGGASFAGPLVAAGLHDGFAGLWLAGYDLATRRHHRLWPALRSRAGLTLCVAALFGGPLAMSGYLLGITMAGATATLAISATYPAVAALLARFVLRERAGARVWAGTTLCIAGAIVVSVAPAAAAATRPALGLVFAGLAALGWGAEAVLAARAMRVVEPAIAITIREFTSFFAYVVFVIPLAGGIGLAADAFTQGSVVFLALLALGGAVSYLWIYWAVSRCGVTRAMPLNVTYALWAVVFSALLTDARPGLGVVVGAVLTAAGAGLVVSAPGPRVDAAPLPHLR